MARRGVTLDRQAVRIALTMARLGLPKQANLAEELGVGPSTVTNWLNGGRISDEHLHAIVGRAGVDYQAFISLPLAELAQAMGLDSAQTAAIAARYPSLFNTEPVERARNFQSSRARESEAFICDYGTASINTLQSLASNTLQRNDRSNLFFLYIKTQKYHDAKRLIREISGDQAVSAQIDVEDIYVILGERDLLVRLRAGSDLAIRSHIVAPLTEGGMFQGFNPNECVSWVNVWEEYHIIPVEWRQAGDTRNIIAFMRFSGVERLNAVANLCRTIVGRVIRKKAAKSVVLRSSFLGNREVVLEFIVACGGFQVFSEIVMEIDRTFAGGGFVQNTVTSLVIDRHS